MQDLGIWKDAPHKAPNHVLVNEYHPGQGISPHKDGAAYEPIVSTVSLGSHTVLEIWEQNEDGSRAAKPKWRILQEPRSLLITTKDAYRDYQHGIAEIEEDRDLNDLTIVNWDLLGNPSEYSEGCKRNTRLSLTYRDVLKVVQLSGNLKFGISRR
jgi:alkylated DNA repair protein alkB family protein 6